MSQTIDLAPSSSRLHQLPKHWARQRRAQRYLDKSCVLPVIPISGFAYFVFFAILQLDKQKDTLTHFDWFILPKSVQVLTYYQASPDDRIQESL